MLFNCIFKRLICFCLLLFCMKVIDHGPQVNITWFKNGAPFGGGERRILKRNRLVIKRATRDDAGTYSCLVSTGTSDMQAKAKLMIKGEFNQDYRLIRCWKSVKRLKLHVFRVLRRMFANFSC